MFRKTIFNLHMIVGLVAAVILFAQGFTGSVMVFEDEISNWLNRDLMHVASAGPAVPLNAVKQSLEAAHPGYWLEELQPAKGEGLAGVAYLINKANDEIGVTFDPATGREIGNLSHLNHWMQRVHQFHEHLGMGRKGSEIAAWMAVLLLGLSITGIVLWWPRKITNVQWSATGRRWFDLHNAVGFYSAIFLFLFAFTGIVIQWDDTTERLIDHVAKPAPAASMAKPADVAPGTPLAQPDTLAQAALNAVPGAKITWVQIPPSGKPVRVVLRYPEDHTPMGRSRVMLDPHTAAVLGIIDTRNAALSYKYVEVWNRQIHTGDIYGWPTRILAAIFSMTLPLMAFSGPLLWWKGRRKSAKVATAPGNVK
jgi:uncharacterized iron-regulated membrane protein